MSLKLGNTAINKTYLGSVEIKKLYIGTNLIYDNSSIDTVVTIDTTSDSATWTPTNIVNSGATLTWEVTGDISPPIAPQVIDKPILNLSSNTGTANITITSSTNFVGFSELWLNNGTTSLEVTDVDISEATALTKIDLFNNNLTTIDISANTALVNPWVQSNTLTAFDPSTNILAEFIAVDTNSLTALDILANVLLTDLWAYDNLLTTAELDAIINDLDTNGLSNGVVKLAGNTGLPLTAASGTAYDALVGKGWDIDVAKYTPVDTEDPVIGTLAYANETDTTVELSMSVASTDNIAVVEHWIYKDFVFEEIVVGATFTGHEITGLTANTNYDFVCVAYDAAGNFSLTSTPTVNFTTDATPTSPTSNLRPVLSNFHVKDGVLDKLYFNSSEIITASTGVNGYTGFIITDKVISQITINTGLLVDHYFNVTVAFDHYSNNTIRYEGGSDIADSESNGVYDFLITDIDNQIAEPSTSSTYYVDKATGSNGDNGTTEGLAWETITYAATQATAGDLIYIKAGDYGTENVVISATGTLVNPIKFIGYTTVPGDSPSLTREIDLTFDSAVMPLLTGVGTDSGIYADYKEYIFIKNIQVENYLNNININHSSYVICDNVYSKDADNPLRMVLTPSFGMRVLNSYVADAASHGMWMYGAHHRIDNCWAVSSRVLNMDYHISYNAGSLENGYNIIKDCYIHSYWDDSHGDHGISIKGEPTKLSEYTLIEDCTLENNGQGIEFRHENSKRNVVKGCYGTRTQDKITAARNDAALVTFRDGCSYNTVIDCNMDTLSHGILFQDNYNEEGQQAGGHNNKVINSVFENNEWDIYVANGIYYPDGVYPLEPTYNDFLNCTFYGSDKLVARGLVSFGSTNEFKNCILELVSSYDGSPSFSYSDFYVSFPVPSGTDNISTKPNFTDKDNGDFSLSPDTPSEVYEGGTDVGVYYDRDNIECISPFSQGAYYKNADGLPTTLLFKSGFETNVQLLGINEGDWSELTGYQGIIGNDEGFDWGGHLIPSYGDGGINPPDGTVDILSGLHVIEGGSTPQDILTNSLVSIIGRSGTLTTVLKQYKYSDPNKVYGGPGSQSPYQINNIINIPDKTYQRMWIRYDDLLDMIVPAGEANWRMLWQYKSGLWDGIGLARPDGFRTSIILVYTDNDGYYWKVYGDNGAGGDATEFFAVGTQAEADPTMGLNIDGWNLVEILTGWATTDTGQILFKLNGVEVFNVTNQRTLGTEDDHISFLTFWSNYGIEPNTSEQWFDEVEIWSDNPLISFISTTSVSILPATDTIDAAATTQLTATVLPANASNKYVHWTSDDEAVATVDDAGLVTGVTAGTATITGTTDDGDFTDTSAITVTQSYGSELIVNGTFDTDVSGWSGDIAAFSWIADYGGSCRLTQVTDFARMYQSIMEIGKDYKLTFDIKEITDSTLAQYSYGDGYISIDMGTHGLSSYEFTFTATSTSLYLRNYTDNSNIVIDIISLKEIL